MSVASVTGRTDLRRSIRTAPACARGYDRPMRTRWLVIGLVLVGAGAVWVAQGLNLPFAPGSFMTSDPTWLAIGALAVAVGLFLVVRGWRTPRTTR